MLSLSLSCAQVIPAQARAPRKFLLDSAVTFSVTFRRGSCLRAQFSPVLSGSQMRTAAVSYLQLSPSFGVCLQHVAEPHLCFGGPVKEMPPDCTEFATIQSYCDLLLPLLRLEGISEAVTDANTFTVSDVPVTWFRAHQSGRVQCGLMILSQKFCADPYRQLDLKYEGSLKDCINIDYSFRQFLCLRIRLGDSNWWIGHGGVKRVSRVREEFAIFFQLHPNCRPPPENVLSR